MTHYYIGYALLVLFAVYLTVASVLAVYAIRHITTTVEWFLFSAVILGTISVWWVVITKAPFTIVFDTFKG